MNKKSNVDKPFLFVSLTLIITGLLVFLSASLSLLSKNQEIYSSILTSQILNGLIAGSIFGIIAYFIPYKFWSAYSFWIYIFSIILLILVFIPGIGFGTKGAQRWISLGPINLQPVEFVKIAYILFVATWYAAIKNKVKEFKKGPLALVIISIIPVILLVAQPDLDNTSLLIFSGFIIYFIAGAKWKHVLYLSVLAILFISLMILIKPHALDRVNTFINPSKDPQGSGYQIKQSLLTIGSGQITGKGFGQSIQKFQSLPEPVGDSIFAVASEEFGFLGSSFLVILYSLFLYFGIRIALRTKDLFGRFLIIGLITVMVLQSFMNIGSMLGVFPLSGLPLIFVSHGGTSLFISLISIGIILNISKFQNKQT
jgi:cell division protein FtsW